MPQDPVAWVGSAPSGILGEGPDEAYQLWSQGGARARCRRRSARASRVPSSGSTRRRTCTPGQPTALIQTKIAWHRVRVPRSLSGAARQRDLGGGLTAKGKAEDETR